MVDNIKMHFNQTYDIVLTIEVEPPSEVKEKVEVQNLTFVETDRNNIENSTNDDETLKEAEDEIRKVFNQHFNIKLL